MAKISWSDLFDFSSDAGIKTAINALNQLDKEYKEFINTATQGSKQLQSNQKQLVSTLNSLKKEILELNEANKADQQAIQKSNAQAKALNETYQAQKKELEQLNSQVSKLTKERQQVAKSVKQVNEAEKKRLSLEKQLKTATGQNADANAKLKVQISEANKASKERAKESLGLVSLYQKESQRLNDLRKRYKDVALAQGQNSKSAKGLQKEITVLDKKLKGLDSNVGQNQRKVGGYGDAINQLIPSVGGLTNQVGNLFKLFLTNPIGIAIAALAALVAAFSKSQKGADFFNSAMEQINATIDVVIGRVSRFATAVASIFEGADIDTALDNMASSFDDIGSEIQGAAKDAALFAKELIKLEQIEIEITEATARRRKEIQELLVITRDTTKSYTEQREALAKANKLETQNLADQVRFAQQKLKIANDELKNTPIDLRKREQSLKIAQAEAELSSVQANSLAKQRELLNRVNELNNRSLAAQKNQKKETLAQEDAFDSLLKKREVSAIETVNLNKEMNDEIDRLNEESAKKREEIDKQLTESARIEAQKRTQIAQASLQALSMIGNQLFINSQINRDNELKAFQDAKAIELEAAGDNAQKRAAIEEQIRERERQANIKAAKAQKAAALFNIGLSTAQAIISIYAQVPKFDFGISATALAISTAGLGALQAGLVASQPLPAFEKGGVMEKTGLAQVSEAGREMIIDPKGNITMTGNKGSELREIEGGSTILNNAITEGILKKGLLNNNDVNDNASANIHSLLRSERDRTAQIMAKTMKSENDILMDTFEKAFKSMPEIHQFKFKRGELNKSVRKGNTVYEGWSSTNSY